MNHKPATENSTKVLGNAMGKPKPTVAEQILQVLELLSLVICWLFQAIYYIGEDVYYKFNKKTPKSVDGQIVLITGTGHGIGKQLALQYAGAGATVVGWDINKDNNDETIREIDQRFKKRAFGYVCDVASRDDVLELAKKVQQEVGDVDIVIANAGIMPSHLLQEHSHNEIRKIMDINVMQLFWLLEAFLPRMKERNHGHIVGISSIAGLAGFANLIPYCASKFAVRGIMESLHEELRKVPGNKIETTTIYPYMVDTGLCKNPKIKFDLFMRMLPPKLVAKCIMKAQRTSAIEKSVPSYMIQFQNFMRLFPHRAMMKLVDLLDSGMGSDLVEPSK